MYTQGAGLAQIDEAINTTIIVKDAILDLGHVQPGSQIEEKIRIQNVSECQQTISAEATIHEIQNDIDRSSEGDIKIDALEIPGNTTESIKLKVNTTDHYGVHSGRIIYQNLDSDKQHTSIFGYVC